MPRARGGPATQEEYEEWLGRLEEEEPLPSEYDLFQATLRSEIYGFNDAQIDKLWELKGIEADYAEHGIHGLNVTYLEGQPPEYVSRRYGIQGMPGLWGWAMVQEIRYLEGW
jgi:hypothetical protein